MARPKSFFNAFSEALLIDDPTDKTNDETYLASQGKTYRQVLIDKPDFIIQRVKTSIPATGILHSHVQASFGSIY